jgi:hypothetical protein
VAFVILELALTGDPMHRVSLAFTAASMLMAALFVGLVVRRPRRVVAADRRTGRTASAV